MVVSHEPWIVAPSVLVAIQKTYVGLKSSIAAALVVSASAQDCPRGRRAAFLPAQKEGTNDDLPGGLGHATKAEAHYTIAIDGTEWFCCALWSGDVEGRLDQLRTVREHRSHMVAIEHIGSPRPASDAGVAQLASATPYSLSFPIAGGAA